MANRLLSPDHLAVPDEVTFAPSLHSHGLVMDEFNVKFYPSTSSSSELKPKDTLQFRLTAGDLFIDPSSIVLHFDVETQNHYDLLLEYGYAPPNGTLNTDLHAYGHNVDGRAQTEADVNKKTAKYWGVVANGHDCIKDLTVSFNGQQVIDQTSNYSTVNGLLERVAWDNDELTSYHSTEAYGPVNYTSKKFNVWSNHLGNTTAPTLDAFQMQKWNAFCVDSNSSGSNATQISHGQSAWNGLVIRQEGPGKGLVTDSKITRRFSLRPRAMGFLNTPKYIWGKAIGSLDLNFKLNNAYTPVSVMALAGTANGNTDLRKDIGSKLTWTMKNPYVTARLIKMAPTYENEYMKMLQSPGGLQLDFDAFKTRHVPLNYTPSNRVTYRYEASLSNVNSFFAYTVNDKWQSDNSEAVSSVAQPGNYIRDEKNNTNIVMSGPATRAVHPRLSALFPYFNVESYQMYVNGVALHSHCIDCLPTMSSEALVELSKAARLFYHSSEGITPPVDLDTYHERNAGGNPCFVMGQSLEKSSLRSGKQMTNLEIQLTYSSTDLHTTSAVTLPTEGSTSDVKSCFSKLWVLINHDKQVVIRDRMRFAVYE